MNLWIIFSVITVLSLVQLFFDRKWKRNLESKFDTIYRKLQQLNFPAEKQLTYHERVEYPSRGTYEKNLSTNTLEELQALIPAEKHTEIVGKISSDWSDK